MAASHEVEGGRGGEARPASLPRLWGGGGGAWGPPAGGGGGGGGGPAPASRPRLWGGGVSAPFRQPRFLRQPCQESRRGEPPCQAGDNGACGAPPAGGGGGAGSWGGRCA